MGKKQKNRRALFRDSFVFLIDNLQFNTAKITVKK